MVIERTTTNPAAAAVATTAPATAGESKTQKTPFGEVLLEQIKTPDVFSLMKPKEGAGGGAPPPAAPAEPAAPTAESVFGAKPWLESPTGSGAGLSWEYNPVYFATKATANKVAAMVGGKVVEQNFFTPYGPLQQHSANQMVELPNGKVINAGLFASLFARGYSQSMLDRMIQIEINGA